MVPFGLPGGAQILPFEVGRGTLGLHGSGVHQLIQRAGGFTAAMRYASHVQVFLVDPAADKDSWSIRSSQRRSIRLSRLGPRVKPRVKAFKTTIGTAGVVNTSMLGVKSYDYGKIN